MGSEEQGQRSERKAKPRPMVEHRELKRELLAFLLDGREHDDDEILDVLAGRFSLSDAQRSEKLPNGRTRFGNLVDHAKRRLNVEGRIRKVRDKRYRIARPGDPPPAAASGKSTIR